MSIGVGSHETQHHYCNGHLPRDTFRRYARLIVAAINSSPVEGLKITDVIRQCHVWSVNGLNCPHLRHKVTGNVDGVLQNIPLHGLRAARGGERPVVEIIFQRRRKKIGVLHARHGVIFTVRSGDHQVAPDRDVSCGCVYCIAEDSNYKNRVGIGQRSWSSAVRRVLDAHYVELGYILGVVDLMFCSVRVTSSPVKAKLANVISDSIF